MLQLIPITISQQAETNCRYRSQFCRIWCRCLWGPATSTQSGRLLSTQDLATTRRDQRWTITLPVRREAMQSCTHLPMSTNNYLNKTQMQHITMKCRSQLSTWWRQQQETLRDTDPTLTWRPWPCTTLQLPIARISSNPAASTTTIRG